MGSMVEVGKITIRSVCGRIAIPDESIFLMLVTGIARGYSLRAGDVGSFVVLSGDFYARKLLKEPPFNGRFISNRALLPEPVTRAIVTGLNKSARGAVEFAYVISAVKSSSSMGGVVFVENALMGVSEHSPLDALIQSIESGDSARDILGDVLEADTKARRPKRSKPVEKVESRAADSADVDSVNIGEAIYGGNDQGTSAG